MICPASTQCQSVEGETEIGGLYAIGDGAGITRGLMQASCTGIAVARDIDGRM